MLLPGYAANVLLEEEDEGMLWPLLAVYGFGDVEVGRERWS